MILELHVRSDTHRSLSCTTFTRNLNTNLRAYTRVLHTKRLLDYSKCSFSIVELHASSKTLSALFLRHITTLVLTRAWMIEALSQESVSSQEQCELPINYKTTYSFDCDTYVHMTAGFLHHVAETFLSRIYTRET